MANWSFEPIYELYAKQVYNLSLHNVQNASDAEDIIQEVFIKIHQKIASFQEEAQVKTWIYRITINHCLDFIKAKKLRNVSVFLLLYSMKIVWSRSQNEQILRTLGYN